MQVESGIPIPQTRRRFPFDQLEVGDSFFVRPEPKDVSQHGFDEAMRRLRSSIVSSASAYGKRHGMRLIVRRVKEEGEDRLRCWRVEPDADV